MLRTHAGLFVSFWFGTGEFQSDTERNAASGVKSEIPEDRRAGGGDPPGRAQGAQAQGVQGGKQRLRRRHFVGRFCFSGPAALSLFFALLLLDQVFLGFRVLVLIVFGGGLKKARLFATIPRV